jgi:hypothetical protein
MPPGATDWQSRYVFAPEAAANEIDRHRAKEASVAARQRYERRRTTSASAARSPSWDCLRAFLSLL